MDRKLKQILWLISFIVLFTGFTLTIAVTSFSYSFNLSNNVVYSLQVIGIILSLSMIFPISLLAHILEEEEPTNPNLYEKSEMIYCYNCGIKLEDE